MFMCAPVVERREGDADLTARQGVLSECLLSVHGCVFITFCLQAFYSNLTCVKLSSLHTQRVSLLPLPHTYLPQRVIFSLPPMPILICFVRCISLNISRASERPTSPFLALPLLLIKCHYMNPHISLMASPAAKC